jgi:hypothetical protein
MTRNDPIPTASEVELRPDGWERFESVVKAAAKRGPKHRTTPSKPAKHPKKSSRRAK